MRSATLTALALSAACNGDINDARYAYTEPLWRPTSTIATPAGIYVELAGPRLAHVTPDGASVVDGIPGDILRFIRQDDGEGVLVFSLEERCDGVDARPGRPVPTILSVCEDAGGDWKQETWLTAVNGATAGESLALPMPYLASAQAGDQLLLWWDASLNLQTTGLVNLTSLLAVDLAAGTIDQIPLGFAPTTARFTAGTDGAVTSALVTSIREVGLLDLSGDTPDLAATFPLTLDLDQAVGTSLLATTPDGRYALVPSLSTQDLYVIDLEGRSINLLSLPGRANDLWVDAADDLTLAVSGSRAYVTEISHAAFDVASVPLDAAATEIDPLPSGEALLWTPSSRAVTRYNAASRDAVSYRLQDEPRLLAIAPTGEFAVAITGTATNFDTGYLYNDAISGASGVEMIDLNTDETVPYRLDGAVAGVTFVPDPAGSVALVMQAGSNELFALAKDGVRGSIDLETTPREIGPYGDLVYIVHQGALGRITFYNPADGAQTVVEGFARQGLTDVFAER